MYRILILLGVLLLFQNCEKKNFQRNPFLQEAKFSITLKLNLTDYNKLKIPGGVVQFDNVGLRGIVVINIGYIMAWDRACPSQALSDCSQMTLESDHLSMLCPCTGVKYSLGNGLPLSGTSSYPMLNYQVVVKQGGKEIEIFN